MAILPSRQIKAEIVTFDREVLTYAGQTTSRKYVWQGRRQLMPEVRPTTIVYVSDDPCPPDLTVNAHELVGEMVMVDGYIKFTSIHEAVRVSDHLHFKEVN